jgi:hypothetical protein
MYVSTETNGLWMCKNLTDPNPVFEAVSSYPFRQPTCISIPDHDPYAVWVGSFGAGIYTGRTAAIGVDSEDQNEFYLPNPIEDRLEIPAQAQAFDFELLDLSGKVVVQQHVSPETFVSISVAQLSAGMYLARFVSATQVRTQKLLINTLH